ncbi:50S ribosomal protein L4 [bacterium]|nr:50S ribosomal protein L4 [bacterium]
MELDLYKVDGSLSGKKVTLPEEVFGIEPNDHVIYLAVKVQLTNSRQGTSASRNRRLIHGGGKKPWRQKGRGTARAGSTRSPLWVGGARVFGPQPRDFGMKITKKMKKLARRSALAYKAKDSDIVMVEDFSLESPKTKALFAILQNLSCVGRKILLLVPEAVPLAENKILLASRNIPGLEVRAAKDVSTYDLLNCKTLLVQESSIENLEAVL